MINKIDKGLDEYIVDNPTKVLYILIGYIIFSIYFYLSGDVTIRSKYKKSRGKNIIFFYICNKQGFSSI